MIITDALDPTLDACERYCHVRIVNSMRMPGQPRGRMVVELHDERLGAGHGPVLDEYVDRAGDLVDWMADAIVTYAMSLSEDAES